MSTIYSQPPEWNKEGTAPPLDKRNAGWQAQNRVPASWLNWFWNRTYKSLLEIANAFVGHRDASAPHSGHETKTGATAKVQSHSDRKTEVHGVEFGSYVAKTSRQDQRIGWTDVQDKPEVFPVESHGHDDRYYSKTESNERYALRVHGHGAGDLPKASTSAPGIVQLTSARTSTSEQLALTARAMDSHRGSSDHDIRYYTKQQVDQLVEGAGAVYVQPTAPSGAPEGAVWIEV